MRRMAKIEFILLALFSAILMTLASPPTNSIYSIFIAFFVILALVS